MTDDLDHQVDALFTAPRGTVVCQACCYFADHAGGQCTHPNARITHLTWKGEEHLSTPPSERNRHNDCADFRLQTFWDAMAKHPQDALGLSIALLGIGALLYGLSHFMYWLFT